MTPRARRRTAALAMSLALGLAAPAAAAPPLSPVQAILYGSPTPVILRARLDSLAVALESSDPISAGEARYHEGTSFLRGGQPDSAIGVFQRAAALRGNREDLLALADARLLRQGTGDPRAVLIELRRALEESGGESSANQAQVQGRMGWAYFLAGRADSAHTLLAGALEVLGTDMEWRYRGGVAALANGREHEAFDLLLPVAIASRMQDEDVMLQLKDAAKKTQAADRVTELLTAEIHSRDAREQRGFEAWGARRVAFKGADGFPLVGIALPPRTPSRTRVPAAVILMAPGDTLPLYDSLAIALRRHGVASILVPPRGTNWAVAPSCPLPGAWMGREEDLQHRAAADVARAVRALAAATPIDTARVLVVGVSPTTTIAVEAARLDRRVRALLLVSPYVSPVDRGTVCAMLGAARVPAFFQIAPEDFNLSYELTDRLYQAGNRPASRVVDATVPGHGVGQFRRDPTLAPRFLGWLDGALKPTAPKATRPATPR
ncbi:MAG TPA: acetylxylan esterase [Candidatus Eisenbacteria bacterium]